MKISRRVAIVRRQVWQLAAIAAERAAQADGYRGSDRFRQVTEAEAEAEAGRGWRAAGKLHGRD